MRDYNTPVRIGYFKKLNGSIISDGLPIRLYPKQAPNDALYPYIIISTQTGVDDSTKNQQGQQVTILIDIVTGFQGAINDDIANNIADQIFTLINPKDKSFIEMPSYLKIISTNLLLDTDLQDQNGVYKIYRRLLRFGHIIHEQ
ncbi:MAG: hypothetical protein WB562_06100 [Candidatus Sulfotelmatobacter sp.]